MDKELGQAREAFSSRNVFPFYRAVIYEGLILAAGNVR